MTSQIENTLGRHEERLNALDGETQAIRDQQKEDRADVRGLKNWLMGILAAGLGGLALQLVSLLLGKK